MDGAYVQMHLEPSAPLEVGELTGALEAFARQYEAFAVEQAASGNLTSRRLLIASVSPGSIDVNFIQDAIVSTAPLLGPMMNQAADLIKFAKSLKGLIDAFAGNSTAPAREPTIKDCEDVVNIVGPIAQTGGVQTFNTYNNSQIVYNFVVDHETAKRVFGGATRKKAELLFPNVEPRQRVSMIWTRLDRDKAKTSGVRSPDHGLIEDVDDKPHAVMFTDEMTYLKDQMIADEENPMKRVYFVDVEVSRVSGNVAGYRITGFHGSDDYDDGSRAAS